MNTLRNFVVIFFLGIIVFLAGVLVGKSLSDLSHRKMAQAVAEMPATLPVQQVVPVADREKTALGESARVAPAPLPLSLQPVAGSTDSAQQASPTTGLPLPGDGAQEIHYTFYKTLTSEKETPVGAAESDRRLPVKKPDTGVGKKDAILLPRTPTVQPGGIVLQVASYDQEGKARLFRNHLVQEGYGKAVVVAAAIAGKGTWYRVRIVDIPNPQTAIRLQKRLQEQEGITSFVVK
ncbi:MAG: SPOR domain-containing protein [Deltaproteobacteria bacterium]|nr:SPOR domain-containing protein [Candidatus Anaeroferrophillus wilburensis]MBN2889884.1 SPOR domain-containing protein [Deltaproteobacteria bacterium]